MKLLETGEQHFARTATVCRQSVFLQLIGSVVLASLFVGAPFLWHWLDAPAFVVWCCAALAALVVPICLGEMMSVLKPTNWVMALQDDGVWVNLRSFRNRKFAAAKTVLFLEWGDVQAAMTTKRQENTSLSGDSRPASVVNLDLELLNSLDLQELRHEIQAEGKRRTPSKFGSTSRSNHFPVELTDESILRIRWQGPATVVTPGISTVLPMIVERIAND